MKTKNPQVSVILDTTKKRKDGRCPLFINVCWKGRAKKATSIYCFEEQFNKVSFIIKGDKKTTSELHMMLDEVYDNINECDLSVTTAKQLLQKNKEISYLKLLSEMSHRRGLSEGGVKKYISAYHAFIKIEDRPFYKLSVSDWMGISKVWKKEVSLTTIWGRLTSFKAVMNYGIETGVFDHNPLNEWNYKSAGYKIQTNPRALTKKEVNALWEWYMKTGDISAMFWFASYYFNGMALVDIIKYDWSSVRLFTGRVSYFSGKTTNRSKTNIKIPVICMIDRPEDFTETDKKKLFILDKLQHTNFNKSLNAWTKQINKNLKKSGIDNITFYSARHTYCTDLVNSNVPLNDIATLMGRNVMTLNVYIKQLNSNEHLAEVLKNHKP